MLKKKNSLAKLHSVENRHSTPNKKNSSNLKTAKQNIESVFKKLYPIVPNQNNLSPEICISLSYKTKTLKVKVPKGV